jgi:hypothetical protein
LRGRPPGFAAGISGSRRSHCASLKSLGRAVPDCLYVALCACVHIANQGLRAISEAVNHAAVINARSFWVRLLALVVEDETLLRLHAAGLLQEHGFAVLEAANAAEALTVLQSRGDVRILFTDIQMPGALDGMDLARGARALASRLASDCVGPHQAPAG